MMSSACGAIDAEPVSLELWARRAVPNGTPDRPSFAVTGLFLISWCTYRAHARL